MPDISAQGNWRWTHVASIKASLRFEAENWENVHISGNNNKWIKFKLLVFLSFCFEQNIA